jgi:tetratricopeptide (TPR) repeat protein
MRARLAAALCVTALVIAPSIARAQSPAEIQIARQTAIEGLAAYKAHEYDKAIRLFQDAHAVYPSGQILRMLGYSHLAAEHWQAALDALEQARDTQTGALSPEDKKDVEEQIAKALTHFGAVTVTSKVEGASVSVDGAPTKKLPLDKPVRMLAGKHTFVVRADAHLDATKEIDVGGGAAVDLDLEPELKDKPAPVIVAPPPPPPPPAPKTWLPHQRVIGFAAAGTGVLLGGAALATALVGAHVRSNVASDAAQHDAFYGAGCAHGDPRLCQFDVSVTNNEADQADALRDWSIALVIPAAVLTAGGALLIVQSRGKDDRSVGSSVSCGVAGAGLACRGAF